jgi:hypothetical protein
VLIVEVEARTCPYCADCGGRSPHLPLLLIVWAEARTYPARLREAAW